MHPLALVVLVVLGYAFLGWYDQAKRIVLLSRLLSHYQIEALMERLNNGYMRALTLEDEERQALAFEQQHATEQQLAEQLQKLSQDLRQQPPADVRISKVPLPFARHWLPAACFDLASVMTIHANGVSALADNPTGIAAKPRARQMLAEVLLMQHTCHWFCRNRRMASARLLQRHQTPYEDVLGRVSQKTRDGYGHLAGV
ncbi:hypothetical protein [Hydrogenophaga sp. 5NK40-0174]|uniref:hypothetical protein n=1 Tax=Hydrogenophaga sp. 5NK40-0174 TaxID=3127649 RepID=UPI0031042220